MSLTTQSLRRGVKSNPSSPTFYRPITLDSPELWSAELSSLMPFVPGDNSGGRIGDSSETTDRWSALVTSSGSFLTLDPCRRTESRGRDSPRRFLTEVKKIQSGPLPYFHQTKQDHPRTFSFSSPLIGLNHRNISP